MANHASALKRHRQSLKLRDRNRACKTRVKNIVKTVREAVSKNDLEAARTALKEASSVLDKAASKGVLHRRNAARRISRLAQAVEKAGKAAAAE